MRTAIYKVKVTETNFEIEWLVAAFSPEHAIELMELKRSNGEWDRYAMFEVID